MSTMMPTTSVPWMGNRVEMWQLEGTELTAVEWRRPWNGSMRGFRVVSEDELSMVCSAVEEATAELRPAPRLEGVAGNPLDLEAFFDEVLDR
ncbi:hypothetical protein [Actinomycetospora sp.]|uniref:hypothetical protein n=1 Tax=Actinomycetospora sp. TaxID=1872135 RepID=UPI002F3E9875